MAAYLGHEPPARADPAAHDDLDDPTPGPAPWQHAGMGAVPASAEVRAAATPQAVLAAYERMFFGDVKNVEQL